MSPKITNVKVGDFIKALERDGFIFKRQSGSHQIYAKPETGRQVLIAYHSRGETLLKSCMIL
jgi:predicted RNA binding protein YcfA (HicA-like mRNA interferase family)